MLVNFNNNLEISADYKITINMKSFLSIISCILCMSLFSNLSAQQEEMPVKDTTKITVFTFDINKDIDPGMWRLTQKGFEEARNANADYIVINVNTYGGMVNMADSIRTKILDSTIPVYAYITNNAASAGALISIAADNIYMKTGAK